MIRAATIALLLVAGIALAEGVVQESGRQIYIANGTSSIISFADDPSFRIAGDASADQCFTVATWAKLDDATRAFFLYKSSEWIFVTGATDQIRVYALDSGGDYIGRQKAAAITSLEGAWHHYAATYNGNRTSGGFKIYIDGARVDDVNFASGTYNAVNISTNDVLSLATTGGIYSDMDISGLVFYDDYEASAAEIRALASYRGSTNFNGQAVSYPHAIQPDLTSVPDRSSAGNDGTPTDLTWGAGGGEFNGSSSIVTVPDSASLTFTDAGTQDLPFSVSCWVRNYGTSLGIVSKQVYPWSGLGDYAVGCSAGRPFIGVTQGAWGNDRRLIADDALTTGTWHHVAATYDGREGTAAYNGMDVYVDGQSVAATPSINGSYTRMQDTAYNVIVGSWANVHANGAFANLSVYSDVITSNEVATLYAAGRDAPADAISTNNLVLFYDFEADKENKLVLALGPTAASYSTGDSITNGTLILDTSIEANHGTCTDIVVGGVR